MLENRLIRAQEAVIDLSPPEFRELLMSWRKCESFYELSHQWRDNVADIVVAAAEEQIGVGEGLRDGEVYCPLCKKGNAGPYGGGFLYPLGLRRHLLGQTRGFQCDVTEVIFEMTSNRLIEFSEREDLEKQNRLDERRSLETLFLLSPYDVPLLIDEGISGKEPRSDDEMTWIEGRLVQLGFQIKLEDRTKSYFQELDQNIVYADPRFNKGIKFSVFKKPLLKRPTSKSSRTQLLGSFEILDRKEKDLKKHYEKLRDLLTI